MPSRVILGRVDLSPAREVEVQVSAVGRASQAEARSRSAVRSVDSIVVV